MQSIELDSILKRVQKPSRYMGKELNTVEKPLSQVDVHLAAAFPDVYEVGMSHIGLQILYYLANSMQGVFAERVFAPAADMEKVLKEENIPLFSLESKTLLRDFNLIGFSLQYELNYTTVLQMLDLGGVPLRSEQRGEGDPLVIGGGPMVFNAEPLAPYFDCFILGDGEDVLLELLELYRRLQSGGRVSRYDFLIKAATSIPGAYVPSFYKPLYEGDKFIGISKLNSKVPSVIEKRAVHDLDKAFYPNQCIIPFLELIHDRTALEIFRGCSQGCRFCQAGFIYRPVRERSLSQLKDIAKEIIEGSGFEEISLTSLSSSDYSQIEKLIEELQEEFKGEINLSLPSLRSDSFSVALMNKINIEGTGGVTFAPEAGSQRLRNVINKNISEEEILAAAREAIISGRTHIKLYFMIGLPTEEEEDLLEIVRLINKIKDIRNSLKKKKGRFQINVSISTFVPKPHTPFQWQPQLEREEIKRRQGFLYQRLRKLKGVFFNWDEAENSFIEAVLARGDRRLAPVLETVYFKGGRLEAWNDMFSYSTWQSAFAQCEILPEKYAQYKPTYEEPLPWDHLSTGISREFLFREYKRALEGKNTPDCRVGPCVNCGIEYCTLRTGRVES